MANKETKPTGAEINDTFGGSPVTTTIDENKVEDRELNLADLKISVRGEKTEEPAPPEPVEDTSFLGRARTAGIGRVMASGGFDYVGVSPQREEAKHDNGTIINGSTSVFTPLEDVRFDPSQRCRIGENYFFPTNAARWEDVELNGKPLVPAAKKSAKK